MRDQRLRLAALLTALGLVAAACGGSDTADPTPTTTAPPTTTTLAPTTTTAAPTTTTLDPTLDAPAGFVRHVDVENGFVIDLPDSWVELDTSGGLMEELVTVGGEAAEVDPELLDLALSQMSGSGVAFVLFDPANPGANINLLSAGDLGPISPNLYSQMVPNVMREFGADDIETEVVELPAGDAVLALFNTPAFGTQGLQYSIFTDEDLWVLTLSAADVAPYRTLFGQIAGSFATG